MQFGNQISVVVKGALHSTDGDICQALLEIPIRVYGQFKLRVDSHKSHSGLPQTF